ncbi:diacylglycerol/lipid kinase family protein [Paenibacillus apiarius]|uniref:diacylglycerol/lipid kinase family protein n=1 Tax=Paenibacillus apiarius TaxID=46240 RepID=UPI00197FF7AD|nr:diacylglycerol kinase family protein [Paenibacillus apiarius]MBN3524695.1 diacylglycerol kinase family lipid kinase [Paenibacillus apiarius]
MLFVVNRNAGHGKGLRVWREIEARLQRFGTSYTACVTATSEEAEMRVRMHIDRHPRTSVIVIGGDGTIHRLLPLLTGTEVALGVIPAGSGNDTARGFHLPTEPLSALNIILHGRRRIVDLIQLNGEWTLTALATGFDADVAETVNRSCYKRWCNRLGLGSAAYLIGAAETLSRFKPADANVRVNGIERRYKDVWLTAIANVPSYGGGIRICPQAMPDDGELDICIVHGCNRRTLLRLFPTVLTGKHVELPYVTMLRGQEVHIESSIPRITYGDGERSGMTPLQAVIAPGRLQLLVPPKE